MACPVALASQHVWVDKHSYVDAERKLHSKVSRILHFLCSYPSQESAPSTPDFNVENAQCSPTDTAE